MNIEQATAALATVAKGWPDLTYYGLSNVHATDFPSGRAELFDRHAAEEFVRAITWLSQVPKRKTPHPHLTSYGLKEAAEHWTQNYISNGIFIAAAVHLGFRVMRMPHGPNAEIGISVASKWPKTT